MENPETRVTYGTRHRKTDTTPKTKKISDTNNNNNNWW